MIWSGKAKEFSRTPFKNKYYLYALKEHEFSEPFYIGKGIYNRAKGHKFSGNKRLKDKLDSLNYNHIVEILNVSANESAIYELEKYNISKFKLVDYGGSLLNLLSGSSKNKSSKDYFDLPENKTERMVKFARLKGKPFFASGFIFPSKALAFKTLGLSKNSLKYLSKCKKAFLIDQNWEENNQLFIDKMQEELVRFSTKLEKLKVYHPSNKRVMVEGIEYPSLQFAAIMSGVSVAAIQARIKRGNQKETYFI